MAFETVASLDDIEDEGTFVVDGEPKIVLFRVGTDVFATQFFCTHEDAPMDDGWVGDDCTVECPWHASKFDLRTGEALGPPAFEPLQTYPVRVEDGAVMLDRG
ncbi:non-heme iron oxygenase ferredoxin subunit [Aurantiacibacter sediminis]|uniref:Non-heme iron oxygenase ferredoxin subunit n=1 Tax=Aurantiacibacter sediminis TaxID=2793064 RepID=A0ABS0N6M7_9SPHN|nr:non-heme iron oxygenase ferredoxin subunit [Aurantiacibacter sediminis]MBH5323484.1 non-heme iron oxygenase ferredoxin subunit [Aurantiacibacter sediminis]